MWWDIIKISDEERRKIIDRYRRKKTTSNVPSKAKNVTRKAFNCEMCGQRKSIRAIRYYPPMKKLCNSCARQNYGPHFKQIGEKIEDDWNDRRK